MAKQVKLKAEPRTHVGRSAVRKLKARGIIPAVIYGAKDKPQPLQLAARDINAMMSHAAGENVLVELRSLVKNPVAPPLFRRCKHTPVGGDIRHVDFPRHFQMDETIQAEVPLEPVGTANGVKTSADCSNRTCVCSHLNVCRAICPIGLPWTSRN